MKLTLIMAYYDNPAMLKTQCENIATYSAEIQDNLELIIIDDCSPRWPAYIEIDPLIPVIILRTLVDVAWNQDFCRNLGAMKSDTEWLLLTDIDHLIPESTIKAIMGKKDLKTHIAYRFDRISAPLMQPYKLHPNTWLMTKEFYFLMGGYDERFAGYYGTDGDFRDRVNKFSVIEQLPYPIIRVGRETIADASTTTLVRKKPEDGVAINRIKHERGDAVPIILQFPWEEIYNSRLKEQELL